MMEQIDKSLDQRVIELCVCKDKYKLIPHATDKSVLERHGLYDFIVNRFKDSESISETIFRIYHGIEDRPTCMHCGKPVKFGQVNSRKDPSKKELGFAPYCSVSCSRKHIRERHHCVTSDAEAIELLTVDGQIIENRCREKYVAENGLRDYLLSRYSDNESSSAYAETIYRIVNKINEVPRCPYCEDKCEFKGIYKGYSSTCSKGGCITQWSNKDEKIDDDLVISKICKKNDQGKYELKTRRKDWRRRNGYTSYLLSRYPDTYQEDEALYRIINHIDVRPTCQYCGAPVSFVGFKHGFSSTCCLEHAGKLKTISTLREKGFESHFNEAGNLVIHNLCPVHGDVEFSDSTVFALQRLGPNKIGTINPCPICNPARNPNTSIETIIEEMLDRMDVTYELHRHDFIKSPITGKGKEIDIFLSDYNIAIECNGLYWHSGKDARDNDILKRKLCEQKGIRLISLWEDEIHSKTDLVEAFLRSTLGKNRHKVYARKCEVREISSRESREFIDANHLQGNVHGSIRLGLFNEGTLVQVMTFGKMRKPLGSKTSQDGEFELYRLCSLRDYTVIGGASKLLSYFKSHYEWKKIISYCKKDISNGNVYEKIGFELDGDTGPGYSFWNPREKGERINRFKLRKSEIDDGSGRTADEILKERGWLRCYDSGNKRYIMKNEAEGHLG